MCSGGPLKPVPQQHFDNDGRGVWIGPTRRESIMGDIDKKMGCVKATAG